MNSVFFRFLQDTNAKSIYALPAARMLAYLAVCCEFCLHKTRRLYYALKAHVLACGKDRRGGGSRSGGMKRQRNPG